MPRREKSPGVSCPETKRRSPSCRSSMPCSLRTASRGASGRWGSRPSMWKTAFAPSAPATGRRKRKVDPLSPQGRWQVSKGEKAMGFTVISPFFSEISAPNARRQAMVAAISREMPPQRMTVSLCPKAAQMSRRWAWDLDAGMVTDPVRGPGRMIWFISVLPMPSSPAARPRGWPGCGSGPQPPER